MLRPHPLIAYNRHPPQKHYHKTTRLLRHTRDIGPHNYLLYSVRECSDLPFQFKASVFSMRVAIATPPIVLWVLRGLKLECGCCDECEGGERCDECEGGGQRDSVR